MQSLPLVASTGNSTHLKNLFGGKIWEKNFGVSFVSLFCQDNYFLVIFQNMFYSGISDLANNLGAIARSDTKEFMEALQAGADINIIGQFVSGSTRHTWLLRRMLSTKHNDDEQYVWDPQAGGSFTVTRGTSGEQLG